MKLWISEADSSKENNIIFAGEGKSLKIKIVSLSKFACFQNPSSGKAVLSLKCKTSEKINASSCWKIHP